MIMKEPQKITIGSIFYKYDTINLSLNTLISLTTTTFKALHYCLAKKRTNRVADPPNH